MLRNRFGVLAAVAVATVLCGWVVVNLPVLTTLRDFPPDDTPGMVDYDRARELFGGDETALLALEADDHFTAEGLQRLRNLTERLAEHPFAQRVTSLISAQQMHVDDDDPDTLLIEDYVRDGVSAAEVARAVLEDDLLRGTLVSEDGRLVMILVQSIPSTDECG